MARAGDGGRGSAPGRDGLLLRHHVPLVAELVLPHEVRLLRVRPHALPCPGLSGSHSSGSRAGSRERGRVFPLSHFTWYKTTQHLLTRLPSPCSIPAAWVLLYLLFLKNKSHLTTFPLYLVCLTYINLAETGKST